MSPKEEELERRKQLLGDYIIASNKELNERLQAFKEVSKSVGDFFDSLYKLGQINEKEMLDFRDRYQKFFLYWLGEKKDYRSQLDFVFEQIVDLKLKIANAKANRHEHHKNIYEGTLNDIVLPYEAELLDIIRLEHEVGKLKQEEVPPIVVKASKPVEDIPAEETIEVQTNIPAPDTTEAVIKEDAPKSLEQPIESEVEEIHIPVTLEDKPLKTKTGKPLNNPEHIAAGRKFKWSDDRIPDLIGDFLLEHGCIFDYHLKAVKDFFRTTKCDRKIVFDGNANQLTTLLYDLKAAKHMVIFDDFLGDRIEAVFGKKTDTTRPLILKKSLLADIKKSSIARRVKAGSRHHLDILTYLSEKLNPQE
jgi:hypothetical protein